ncbi:MAG: hypothetical protein EXX96DRAFT_605072 [Benjaminiella poitrasii]|nr:MAG: hypothetical protein EXX96DRAFT_605072 [Benjaminiella poitrasii]
MLKLFKKKKSDKNITRTMMAQQQQQQQQQPVTMDPSLKKNSSLVASDTFITPTVAIAATTATTATTLRQLSASPPIIMMPKPKRFSTPTRAIIQDRFDNDKTQVEEEYNNGDNTLSIEQQQQQQYEDRLLSQLIHTSPVSRSEDENQTKITSSHSTEISDDSSRLYESAQEVLEDEDEVFPLKSEQNEDQVVASSVPFTGPSTTASSATVTPLLHQHQQHHTHHEDITLHKKNRTPSPTIQTDDHKVILQELKQQIEKLEKQHLKERESWKRKEQEILDRQHQMIATLMETKGQLTDVLKDKEIQEKAIRDEKLAYQKQLQQLQLQQLLTAQKQEEERLNLAARTVATNEPLAPPVLIDEEAQNDYQEEEQSRRRRRKKELVKSRSEEYLYPRQNRTRSQSSSSASERYYHQNENGGNGMTTVNRKHTRHHAIHLQHPVEQHESTLTRKKSGTRPRALSSDDSSRSFGEEHVHHYMNTGGVMVPIPSRHNEPSAVIFQHHVGRNGPQQQQQQLIYVKPRRSRSVGRENCRRSPSSNRVSPYYDDGLIDGGIQDEEIDMAYEDDEDDEDHFLDSGFFSTVYDSPKRHLRRRGHPARYYYHQRQYGAMPYSPGDYYHPMTAFPPPPPPPPPHPAAAMIPSNTRNNPARYRYHYN